jgi:hypothetical protein
MVNAHYVIIDFRAKFFIKIQNQASDTLTQVARFRLSQALPSCYARSLASDLGKSKHN